MSYYFNEKFRSMDTADTSVLRLGVDEKFYSLLAETYGVVGKLEGVCRFVPNIDFYTNLLMIQEVCASCELEDIHARFYSFFENGGITKGSQLPLNLMNAMKYIQDGAFSESSIKKIHSILTTAEMVESKYRDGRGGSLKDLLWVYNGGSNPVPAGWIPTAIRDIQKNIAEVNYQKALIMAARIQYQLEILYPFHDYSRVIARMMAMLAIKQGGLLSYPVLGLSACFADDRIEYKNRLIATYNIGEEVFDSYWVKYFLVAVNISAKKAIYVIETLENARKTHTTILSQMNVGNKSVQLIYEYVANTVMVNVRQTSDALGLSFSSVTKILKAFEVAGIIRQVTKKERYRQFGYAPVLDLFDYV